MFIKNETHSEIDNLSEKSPNDSPSHVITNLENFEIFVNIGKHSQSILMEGKEVSEFKDKLKEKEKFYKME